MTFSPTSEQLAIIEAAERSETSLMVTAYAGCAKTTTLELLARALPSKPTLALAFNVKTKKELEKRFPSHFEIKTLNGLGHSAWGRAIGRGLTVDPQKLGKLVTQIAKEAELDLGESWQTIRSLVNLARQAGIVPARFPHKGLLPDNLETWTEIADYAFLEAPEQLVEFSRNVLVECVKASFNGSIDFDDQIYMSAIYNGVFPKFPIVLVDEAQDLSPFNHIQLRKTATDRLIVVGDPKQAIYAFRGADSQSMGKIKALRSEWIDLPLHKTFRCPKIVVDRNQAHAPGFLAASSNLPGNLHDWRCSKEAKAKEALVWTGAKLAGLTDETHTTAVLCRNNAPLLALAFKLIRSGIGVVMLGRDIGKGLVTLAKKILPIDDIPADQCASQITQWADEERSKARAKEQEPKVSAITDREECLLAVLDFSDCKNAGELRKAIDDLFSREYGKITLSTGHRAKGLEWDCVVHLDPWRLPSKFALRAASEGDRSQLEQEQNLKYVIETRTKNHLVLANLEDFE